MTQRTAPALSRDTTMMRALGAILVANSHLEHFYPYAWLAGDGLVGNSFFFFLAGYGLEQSARHGTRHFGSWMWRRIDRIYPTVILVVLTFSVVLGGSWRDWTVGDFVRNLGWPTRYTFVELVMPFYLIFYPVLRVRRPVGYLGAAALLVPVYLIAYVADVQHMVEGAPLRLGVRSLWVHVPAYLQLMFLGAWFASPGVRVPRALRHAGVTVVLAVVYVAAKLAFVRGIDARAYGVLHVLTAVICLGAFAFLTREDVVRRARGSRIVWTAAAFVGGLTLEIYVVHSYVADYEWLWRLPFPANLGLFWLLTLPFAALAGGLAQRMRPSTFRRRTPGAGVLRPEALGGS